MTIKDAKDFLAQCGLAQGEESDGGYFLRAHRRAVGHGLPDVLAHSVLKRGLIEGSLEVPPVFKGIFAAALQEDIDPHVIADRVETALQETNWQPPRQMGKSALRGVVEQSEGRFGKYVEIELSGYVARQQVKQELEAVMRDAHGIGCDASRLLGLADPMHARRKTPQQGSLVKRIRGMLGLEDGKSDFGEIANLKNHGMTAARLRRVGLLLGFTIQQEAGRWQRRDSVPQNFEDTILYQFDGSNSSRGKTAAEEELLGGLRAIIQYMVARHETDQP